MAKSLLPSTVWEKVTAGLLGIIIGMLAYYINRITNAQDEINNFYKETRQDVQNIAFIVDNDPDTKKEDSKELRKIYFSDRSGGSVVNMLTNNSN